MFDSVRFLLQMSRREANSYRAFKDSIGSALLPVLELPAAAEVIHTVSVS